MQQSERELRERLSGLERQAEQLHGGLEAERAARERAEQMLAALQQAQRGAQLLLSGLADTVARLREAAQRQPTAWRPSAPRAAEPPTSTSTPAPNLEPEATPVPQRSEASPAAPAPPQARPIPPGEASGGEMAAALAAAVERLRARVEEQAAGGGHVATTRGEGAAAQAHDVADRPYAACAETTTRTAQTATRGLSVRLRDT